MTTFTRLVNRFSTKINNLKRKFNPQTWPSNSMVYYTGHTDYQWTPESVKIGIGGSELAIINLAQEWHKLGYSVTVYNNCGDGEGCYDGVEYRHYNKFNKYDTFHTLIIWRYPWRVDPQIKAKNLWLDLHEVLLPEQVTKAKLAKFHRIFVKSNYHRQLLPEIRDSQITIISNGCYKHGLNLSNNPKETNKLIYASNYIRGLERMLTYGWPIIKKEIPQARLHIYYGWQCFNPRTPEQKVWKDKMMELMKQPGVREGGRIGVEELIKEKSTAAIHYYGCTFQEIDCISVRESALVGCVPVTTDYAALGEKPYCLKVPGNPYLQETQESLAGKIVELLKNPQRLEEMRLKFQDFAKEETWDKIALAWLDYL